MNTTWLVLDVPYLCYRALYSTGGLSHEGKATGTVYGMLQSLKTLSNRFGSEDYVFCFDHGKGKREQWDSSYKAGRRDKYEAMRETDPDKYSMICEMKKQVEMLKTEYLPETLKLKNVFYQDGYEADDVIASVCGNSESGDRVVVVSGDEDLLQLLGPHTLWYDPKKKLLHTEHTFTNRYGIKPSQWAEVKAIAGCSSDSVRGVKGVGEKTAIDYLAGKFRGKAKEKKINDQWELIEHNFELVELPFPGVKEFVPEEQNPIDRDGWARLTTELGMKSLMQDEPERDRIVGFFKGKSHAKK